eukprot:scaffold2204_cov166-Amphora_coffeaeformis.AAC.5
MEVTNNSKKVLDAIKAIPNNEKRAYLMALAQCPHLLHRESCIERFLQCDSNQGEKAAKRFVDYWEKRRQVYDDNAFLPLALSEPRVLSESCKALMQNGWISLLPPDKYGRRVCLLNLSVDKGTRHFFQEDKARCIFFVLQCLSEQPPVQTTGIAVVVVYGNFPHTAPTTSIKAFDEILKVMPIKVVSLHVIHTGKSGHDDGAFYESFVPVALKTMLNAPIDQDHDAMLEMRARIHVNKSRETILSELEQDGFESQNLPAIIGGSWTSVHHEAWLKLRAHDERNREAQAHGLEEFCFPGKELTTREAPVGEVREKIRDAWHSKLKRTRKRCKTKAIQIRVNHLKDQQEKLKTSTKLLEQALKDANQIIAKIEARKETPFAAGSLLSPVSLPSMHYPGPHAYGGDRRSLMTMSTMTRDDFISAIRAEEELLRLARMSSGSRLLMAPSAPPPYGKAAPQTLVLYPHAMPLLVSTHITTASGELGMLPPANWRPAAVAPQEWRTRSAHPLHLSAPWY